MSPEHSQLPAPETAQQTPETLSDIGATELGESERYQVVKGIVDQFESLSRQCQAEDKPFDVVQVENLLDIVRTVPAGEQAALRQMVLGMCLANPNLHSATRQGIIEELAKPPTA